jgi:NAD+ diphosphatase
VSPEALGPGYAFLESGLDRASDLRTDPRALDDHWTSAESRMVLLRADGRVLLEADGRLALEVPTHLGIDAEAGVFLGLRGGAALWSTVLADDRATALAAARGGRFADLRGAAASLSAVDSGVVAYARALAHWHSRKRWCGVCGAPTRLGDAGHRAACTDPACAATYFPRTDPAIIVLVADDRHCLLGRQAAWPVGRYSTLAGFVEPGETLEQAVAREVHEESGVRIDTCRYLGSQPWPFPASLMLGFEATAQLQVPKVGSELADACWFDAHEMPGLIARGELGLPPALSIAYHLIDRWFHRLTGEHLPPGQPLGTR